MPAEGGRVEAKGAQPTTMSKTKTAIEERHAGAAEPLTLDSVRAIADALYRAADECHHQHRRSARVLPKSAVDAEEEALGRLCSVCDDSLEKLALEYEKAAATIRPSVRADDPWWRRANALWLASREYARRHRSCDTQTRRVSGAHSANELEALHMEFELEASALLALRQACDDYARERPQAL